MLQAAKDLYRRASGAVGRGYDRTAGYARERGQSFRGGYEQMRRPPGERNRGTDRTFSEAAGRGAGGAQNWVEQNPVKASVLGAGAAGAGAAPLFIGEGPDEELMAEYERLVSMGQFQGSFEEFLEIVMGDVA